MKTRKQKSDRIETTKRKGSVFSPGACYNTNLLALADSISCQYQPQTLYTIAEKFIFANSEVTRMLRRKEFK